jgi:UDP-GlcNAc:undecaprenyl-phosphate GlcNAc-1-phosphate transferase
MTPFIVLLVAGALFGLLFTPLVTSASTALGLVDAPGGRKVHSAAVPRVGGLAVCGAAIVAWLAAGLILGDGSLPPPVAQPMLPLVLAAMLVFAIGLADDLKPLPVWPKLLVQTSAAAVVVASGVGIERLTLGGSTWHLGILTYPLTFVWIIGLTNAFNLIDGIDGLAAGIAVIAGGACAAILVWRGHVGEALLLTTLVGGALGFLLFNLPPASIFLGDGGSLLFGFVLASTAITGWQKGATALAAGVPLLIFALPIADSGAALIRRLLRRPEARPTTVWTILRQIAEPDREHIHHRLMALGWPTRRVVLVLYLVTLVLSVIALATARYD